MKEKIKEIKKIPSKIKEVTEQEKEESKLEKEIIKNQDSKFTEFLSEDEITPILRSSNENQQRNPQPNFQTQTQTQGEETVQQLYESGRTLGGTVEQERGYRSPEITLSSSRIISQDPRTSLSFQENSLSKKNSMRESLRQEKIEDRENYNAGNQTKRKRYPWEI